MKSLQLTIIISLFCFVPQVAWGERAATPQPPTPAHEEAYEEADVFNPIPLENGESSPFNGVLIDEATISELILLRASDTRLRTELEVRQNLWTEQRQIYENALSGLQTQVETLTTSLAGREESWWDRHGSVVIGTIGFVVGAVVTILVAWAVAEAISPNATE